MDHWSADTYRNIWLPYCQMKTAPQPLRVVKSEREFLTLDDGRVIVDGIASWWTACHGYNHPYIAERVAKQLHQMPHVMMGGLCHDQALHLSSRLADLLPGPLERVFLCDSGSVAVEVALKIAVQFGINRNVTGKNRFVCFQNAYHGDTTGAMSVCDPVDSMHAHFKGFLLEQFPSPIPKCDADIEMFDQFLHAKKDKLAGVIVEPLAQMATGMHFHSPDQLKRVFDICKRHELLFIADEIATGFGRTGTMFAYEQANIAPDIVCVGKALTGGTLSLAATVATDRVYSAFHGNDAVKALMHGPTYMGNPLACAAANASLDLFESDDVLTSVKRITKRFHLAATDLNRSDLVIDARSLGALLAIEFAEALPQKRTRDFFLDREIWLRPIANVLYVCPAFNIRDENLERVLSAITEFVGLSSL